MTKVMLSFYFLSLITLLFKSNVVVFAGRPGIYERHPDPQGQFPRLGACPDDHACIFPADV